MLSRSALRKVARSQPALTGQASLRQLSHAARPSSIALGKRPAVPRSYIVSSIGASRGISWTPWKPATPLSAPADEATASGIPASTPNVDVAAPAPEPILTESHPDLQPASSTVGSSSVPAPASDVLPSSTSPATEAMTSGVSPLSPADAALLPQPPADAFTPSLEDLILHSGKPLEEVLNSQEAIHAVMKVSDLKLLGYEHGFFSISGWFTDAIVGIHTHVGLPWWATIASITVAIRLALSPVLISTQKHNVRLAAVNPQIQAFMEKAKEAQARKDVHAQTVIGQAMRQLLKDHNVNPLRTLLLPAIQLPIFLTFFNIVRGLTNLPLPQLKEGGIGWVTDLTAADPYYILPLTSLLFTNLVFKFGADGMATDQKAGSPMRTAHMRNFIQITTLVSLPFVSYFPAAILFYWTFSSGFTLLQSMVLRIPFIKALLGIPAPPVVPPPPGAEPFKNPSYLDSFNAVKEWWMDSKQMAEQKRNENIAAIAAEQRSSSSLARRNEAFVERIQETNAPVAASASEPAAATGPVPPPTPSARALSPREAEKQRRIAAAREKRARQ
ncbi:hypothetical protein IAU60_005108 [Kwoniella sp. DSM 27419]